MEGEIRVAMQYLFQAWGARGPKKYRDMLIATGTDELAHIEMLATAVALNLEGAPTATQEEAAKDSVVNAVLGGMNARHLLSAGLAATPEDANGNPFNASHEHREFSYAFIDPRIDRDEPPQELYGRFAQGPSLDGKGEFTVVMAQPLGDEPMLAPAKPQSGAQEEQLVIGSI